MKYQARFAEAALNDLEESAAWYNQKKENLGMEFITAVEEKIEFILSNPESFPFKYSDRKSVSIKRFPFHIVFIIEGTAVIILAIAHHKREPSFWQRR